MPQKLWIPLEELVADDLNDYLQNQVVPQFTSTGDRDTNWGAPPEGALCVIDDNLYQYVNGAWYTPHRRIGYIASTSSSTAASAETVVVTVAATTVPNGRLLRLTARWRAMTGGAGEACTLRIREGTSTAGTQLADYVANMCPTGPQANSASGGTMAIDYTPAAGSKQWVLTSQSSTATNVQVLASATSPISLAVVDQGAA
jgi:hypothetical protein